MRSIVRTSMAVVVLFCSAGAARALTPDQCTYFSNGGHTPICHHTGSATQPFIFLNATVQACVAHAEHPIIDYVAVGDPNCQGVGCLPTGAPCDATLPCCDGLACSNGVCAPIE